MLPIVDVEPSVYQQPIVLAPVVKLVSRKGTGIKKIALILAATATLDATVLVAPAETRGGRGFGGPTIGLGIVAVHWQRALMAHMGLATDMATVHGITRPATRMEMAVIAARRAITATIEPESPDFSGLFFVR